MVGKIHFINRIDRTNVGDWNCCPLSFYFSFFKPYNLIRHDIDFIDWTEITRQDVVILGAGGLLDVTWSFNAAINKLLQKCDNVIGWGIGFNTHGEQWHQGDNFEKIDVAKFKLIGIRDYNHPSGLEWLPGPSALAPELQKKSSIKRKFGVIEHRDLPLPALP